MNNSILATNSNQTMTLKEITDLLDVRHNDAMATVDKMSTAPEFGEIRKIRSSYINNLGSSIAIDTYDLDKRQSMAVSAKLNTGLLMKVIDRWQELENKNHQPTEFPPSILEIQIAESAARMLRMSDTSKVRMLGSICEEKGVSSKFLPSYSDESLTRALGDLLKDNNAGLSARTVNPWLISLGILEELSRRTAKGGEKKFKSITEYGLKFGKNETSVQSPNETQPRYYVAKFPELLKIINAFVSE